MADKQALVDKLLSDMSKDYGDRIFKASEAPPVKVIPTGITSLDIATGVGGWPRGIMVEVFGKESTGKTALLIYAMAEAHKRDGFTALVNLESGITKEGWLDWAVEIAPPGFDPERVVVVNPSPGTEAVHAFAKFVASGAFDIVGYDSIGAMSTDKELEVGEKKQAYGQSALVTQLIKQAAKYAYDNECIPIMLNQIRDEQVGQFTIEKSPGGRAKDHFATLRVHLKSSNRDWKKIKMPGAGPTDQDEFPGFRVNARIVKNKVGRPRMPAGWNYWNYPSPDGVVGIDTFQDTVDVALRRGAIRRGGAWYYHDAFPDGKLNGGPAVTGFLRENPSVMEEVKMNLVRDAYNMNELPQEVRETLTDVV